jgi:hypothetical protein
MTLANFQDTAAWILLVLLAVAGLLLVWWAVDQACARVSDWLFERSMRGLSSVPPAQPARPWAEPAAKGVRRREHLEVVAKTGGRR